MKNEALTFNMVQEMEGKEKIQKKQTNTQTNTQTIDFSRVRFPLIGVKTVEKSCQI